MSFQTENSLYSEIPRDEICCVPRDPQQRARCTSRRGICSLKSSCDVRQNFHLLKHVALPVMSLRITPWMILLHSLPCDVRQSIRYSHASAREG